MVHSGFNLNVPVIYAAHPALDIDIGTSKLIHMQLCRNAKKNPHNFFEKKKLQLELVAKIDVSCAFPGWPSALLFTISVAATLLLVGWIPPRLVSVRSNHVIINFLQLPL